MRKDLSAKGKKVKDRFAKQARHNLPSTSFSPATRGRRRRRRAPSPLQTFSLKSKATKRSVVFSASFYTEDSRLAARGRRHCGGVRRRPYWCPPRQKQLPPAVPDTIWSSAPLDRRAPTRSTCFAPLRVKGERRCAAAGPAPPRTSATR